LKRRSYLRQEMSAGWRRHPGRKRPRLKGGKRNLRKGRKKVNLPVTHSGKILTGGVGGEGRGDERTLSTRNRKAGNLSISSIHCGRGETKGKKVKEKTEK